MGSELLGGIQSARRGVFGLNTRMSNGSFGQIALNARSCRSSLVGVWTELGAGRGGRLAGELGPGGARGGGVVDGPERALARGAFGAIVVHLLGLDYCKDRGLPTDGAMLVLRRLTQAALQTDRPP